jgi:hypothetical protein
MKRKCLQWFATDAAKFLHGSTEKKYLTESSFVEMIDYRNNKEGSNTHYSKKRANILTMANTQVKPMHLVPKQTVFDNFMYLLFQLWGNNW